MKIALFLALSLSPALAMAEAPAPVAGEPSCKADPQNPGQFTLSCGTTVIGPVGDAQTCAMMGQMLCKQMPAPTR